VTQAIILTTQRSGSTLLVSSLQSHPDILCRGELLIAGMGMKTPRLFENHRYAIKLTRFVWTGAWHSTRTMRRFYEIPGPRTHVFKAMYNHLSPPWTLRWLLRRKDIRVIHLRRRNLLKQYISFLLMTRRRDTKWLPNTTVPLPPLRVRVSPEHALRYFARNELLYPRFDALFAGHVRMPLIYEDIIAGQQIKSDVAEELCDFLDVPRRPLTTQYIKINPDSLREIVMNYDELSDALRATRYSSFLD